VKSPRENRLTVNLNIEERNKVGNRAGEKGDGKSEEGVKREREGAASKGFGAPGQAKVVLSTPFDGVFFLPQVD